MTKENIILENLQNRVVQEAPIKLIYANNDFSVFDKGASEFYGAEDEFISDQPLEGIKWDKDMDSKDFKKLPPVFSCKLPIIMDEVFNTIFHKKKMKQALQSPAHQTALIDRLIDSMKTKAITTLNKKIVEIISDKDNYKTSAWVEISKEEAHIDSLDKAITILKLIKSAYNGMDEVSTSYNKGYQKPEIHFLADVARDSNLNPHKLFKAVITKKLENGVIATIHDEKSVFYRIINPEEIQHEKTLGGGMEKFAYEVEVVGGMIPFTNS
ncbi:11326_t:CDS:2 [Funneliformis geosporum]|nr:11326_t:CDS:2 [Funneliformis geosporum]